jgi:hypothetical protein
MRSFLVLHTFLIHGGRNKMLVRPTTLIVGAGSSAELELPSGDRLLEQIADRLRLRDRNGALYTGNETIRKILIQLYRKNFSGQDFEQDCNFVAGALKHASSIDNFVNTHSDKPTLVSVSKLAIFDRILAAERRSILDKSGNINYKPNASRYWLEQFVRRLFTNISKSQVSSVFDKLKIVCFNYDRCIEIFLYFALQKYFGIDQIFAKELIQKIDIVHPYGTLGDIWPESASHVEYGQEESPNFPPHALQGIKTFSEGLSDVSLQGKLTSAIEFGESIVFLGFAFAQQNMKLLEHRPMQLKRVYATTYDWSESNLSLLNSTLSQTLGNSAGGHFHERKFDPRWKCDDLIQNYSGELFGF